MTYGGISCFVVVFALYPMGLAIYREANLPRTLLPAAIAFGSFGITMICLPGSPQIQNIIPTSYYGTTATAGPLMGLLAVCNCKHKESYADIGVTCCLIPTVVSLLMALVFGLFV